MIIDTAFLSAVAIFIFICFTELLSLLQSVGVCVYASLLDLQLTFHYAWSFFVAVAGVTLQTIAAIIFCSDSCNDSI
jgi:hypothetical protein